MKHRPCEALPARCDCVWTFTQDLNRRGTTITTIQHGENPEAKMFIADLDYLTAEVCDLGHLVPIELWAKRVVEYEHPE